MTRLATDQAGTGQDADPAVTIVSPRPGDDAFARGDIVPIELEFDNTDTGTLTFGDRNNPQNIKIQVTVRDTDGDGTATVYLNTFQVGHGASTTCTPEEEGGPSFEECGEITVPDDSRNHGFFTHPDDGSALVGQDGQTAVAYGPTLDTVGGSQGGLIIAPHAYDLVVTAGENSDGSDQSSDDQSIVEITGASAEGVTIWTAPGTGKEKIGPELSSDVRDAIENGVITPADGAIASEDFYVLQLEASGLEGLMHEAVVQDPSLEVEEFLPAPGKSREDDLGDHLVTEEFFAAQNLSTPQGDSLAAFRLQTQETFESVEARTTPEVALDPVILDTRNATSGVVAATDDSGNLDEFFIPMEMENGDELSRERTWLAKDVDGDGTVEEDIPSTGDAAVRPGLQFDSRFILGPTNSSQEDVLANDPFGVGLDESNIWDYELAHASVDGADPVLVVPQENNVSITGTTTVAAGTNLTVSVATVPGEDPAFFKLHPAVFPEYQETGDNIWEISEDFAAYPVGTDFEINIRRTGTPGRLTDDTDRDGQGDPVAGAIGEIRGVGDFTFSDQRSGGQAVLIDSFRGPYDSIIQIVDSNGNQIGLSEVIPGRESPQTRIAIPLSEDISESQELTAVAWLADNGEPTQQYRQDGSAVSRSAQITIENVRVSDLDPRQVTISEPQDITVSATITNEGDHTDTQTVSLVVDGNEIETTEVTLAGGEERSIEFTLPESELSYGGTFFHSIQSDDDSQTGVVTVESEPTEESGEKPTVTQTEESGEKPTVTQTEESTKEPTDTLEDSGDGAGFGIVISMVAFLSAALLAARRRTSE